MLIVTEKNKSWEVRTRYVDVSVFILNRIVSKGFHDEVDLE